MRYSIKTETLLDIDNGTECVEVFIYEGEKEIFSDCFPEIDEKAFLAKFIADLRKEKLESLY